MIDFDCPGVNLNFPPVNVFEENYSIANSFDLHTTKGNSQLIRKIALAEKPSSNLEISKNDRIEIEERFFPIDKTFLKQLSHVVKEKYFRNWEELNFNEEFIEGYIKNILSRIENLKNYKSHDYSEFDKSSEEYKTLKKSIPKLYYDDELTNTQEFDSKEDISIT